MKIRLSRLAPWLAVLALAGCGGGHQGHVLARTSTGTKTAPQSRITSSGGASGVSSSGQSAMGSVHPPGWGATPPGFTLPPQQLTTVPTATMYDAVTVGNIPANPFAVAGYPFGRYVTWDAILSGFAGAHHVSVAIAFLEHGMCGDFEPGDMSPSQAGQWAKDDMAAGFPVPCEYGDLSNMPAIEASDRAVLGPDWRAHVLLWLAWYRNVPGLVDDADAVQYTDDCLGRSLDCSTVSLTFLKIAQPPYVAPAPKPPKASGVANAEISESVATGKWTIRPLAGNVTFGPETNWSGLEVQRKRGTWRIQALPYNTKPLGG